MNAGVETLVKQANQCSTATNQNNLCKTDGIIAAGDVTIGGDQSNKAKINFSCINSASAQGDMSQEMMAQLLQDLKSTNDTKLATTLNALAENKSKSGFISTPPIGSVDSNTTQTVNQTIENETVNKIQNIQNSNRTVEAYLASYQWAIVNPGFFALPRRIFLGAILDF